MPMDRDVVYETLNDNDCAYLQDILFIEESNGVVQLNKGI